MHRPRNARVVTAMKIGAWLFLLAALLMLSGAGMIGYGFYQGHRELLLLAYGCLLAGLLCLLFYRLASGSARCPLCTLPVLLSRTCQRNRNSRTLFGSYRFRVARDIAFTGSFRCPYCGEQTVCRPRDSRRR